MQSLNSQQRQALQKGQQALSKNQVESALSIARHLAAEAPAAPDAQQFLGICLAEHGQLGAAESAFLKALARAPGNALILTNLAALYRKNGKLEAAVRSLRQAVSQSPDFAKAWAELGKCLLTSDQHREAIAALDRAVKLNPRSVSAWHALGRARRAEEDYEGAESAFERAVEYAPNNGVAWMNLGAVRRLLGAADLALECYSKASACGYSGPDLADARVGALLDLGHPKAALTEARRLVDQHPIFTDGHRTLAHLLWQYGSSLAPGQEPLGRFKAAVETHGDRSLKLAYGQFLLEAGQAEEALEVFGALRSEADHPILKAMVGNAYEKLGQTGRSAAIYADAHVELSDDPPFLCAYARHLLKAGEWTRARDMSSHAVSIAPDDQEPWAYLATAWRLLNDDREFWLCDYNRLISFHNIPAPSGYDSQEAFLAALEKTLEPMHQAHREPVEQSLRGGSQTPGRLFGRPDSTLASLQQSLTQIIEAWISILAPKQDHPFYRRLSSSIRYTGSWSVKLWSSGQHVNHIHPQGWMSSAYYVALPPSVTSSQQDQGQCAGAIQFGQPPAELELNLEPRRIIQPKAGHLALFPSYLWHGTVPFSDEEPRMTIAFDMRPATGR